MLGETIIHDTAIFTADSPDLRDTSSTKELPC
jgi:hypothetical protein